MPISRADMERGRTLDSLTDRVLNFLNQGRGSAFTAEEVAVGVGQIPDEPAKNLLEGLARGFAMTPVTSLLGSFAREGVIDARNVELQNGFRQVYYSAK
jgi:hypothetical protein